MSEMLEGLEHITSGASKRCLVIVGCVHGNEPAGARAIATFRDLVDSGEWQVDGNVYGLIGNPRAVESAARFTGENLNRAFGRAENPESYEAGRAQNIDAWFQSLAKEYEEMFLIDLHSVSMGETRIAIFNAENSKTESWCRDISPITFFLGSKESILPGSLMGAFEKAGGTAIAVECGNHSSETGATVALDHVERALESLGMLVKKSVSYKDAVPYEGAPRTFMLTRAIKPHAGFVWDLPVASEYFVPMGKQFAHDDMGAHIAKEDSYIIMPSKVPQPEDFDAGFLAVKKS